MKGTIIQEFLIGLGWDLSGLNPGEVDQKVGNALANIAKAMLSSQALKSLKEFVDTIAQATTELSNMAHEANTSAQNVLQIGGATKVFGGDAQTAAGTLKSLRGLMTDEALFRGDRVFARLGISIVGANGSLRDTTDVLRDVNKRFQGLSQVRQLELAGKLGLDEATLRLVQQAPAEFDRLIDRQKFLNVLTDEQVQESREYTKAQGELGDAFESVKRILAEDLMPPLTAFYYELSRIAQWAAQHGENIKRIFVAISIIILTVATPALWGLAAAIGAAAVAFIALNAIPIAIGVALAALYLIVQDLWGYFNGEESVLGEWWEGFTDTMLKFWGKMTGYFKKVWNDMKAAWDSIKSKATGVFSGLKEKAQPILDFFAKIKSAASKIWADPIGEIKRIFESIMQTVKAKIEELVKAFTESPLGKFIQQTTDSIKSFFSGGENKGLPSGALPVPPPKASNPTAFGPTAKMTVGTVNINVPSGDPMQVKTAVDDGLFSALQRSALLNT